jgi:hypothetical protein
VAAAVRMEFVVARDREMGINNDGDVLIAPCESEPRIGRCFGSINVSNY